MEQQNEWEYLCPSLGFILRILKAENKKYYNGFVIMPNGKTLTYKEAVEVYKAFICKIFSDNYDTVEIVSYDFTTTYYAICYLLQVLESDHSHYKHFRTIADDAKRIHFDYALDLLKSFVRMTFKFE